MRYLKLQDVPGDAAPVDLISLDLSFISVPKHHHIASGGVVRDPKVHKAVIETVCSGIAALGFTSGVHIESPSREPAAATRSSLPCSRSDESSGSFAFVMTKQSFWAMSCQAHECLQVTDLAFG
ncbi:TPA: hypothetical protein ACH3X1_012789 [Trebouxia sp. C0004]